MVKPNCLPAVAALTHKQMATFRKAVSMNAASKSKDYDIRAAIVRYLLDAGFPRRDIRHELTLDTSSSGGRVDIALLRDDSLHGIEIKSGSDNLDRLSAQVEAYKRSFDYVSVVYDKRHYEKIDYPLCFGTNSIWCNDTKQFVDGWHGDFKPSAPRLLTERSWNRSHATSVVDVASLLWRSEAVAVASKLLHPTKTRVSAIEWMRENANLKEVRPLVIAELRARGLSRWEDAFWGRFDRPRAEAA